VNPRPHRPTLEARAHNAKGQDGVPPIERLIITGNTFTRSGGPAMKLIGIKDSRIENNRIDSPVRATVIARPEDEADRQAIVLRNSTGVELKGNTLTDPENHTQPMPRVKAACSASMRRKTSRWMATSCQMRPHARNRAAGSDVPSKVALALVVPATNYQLKANDGLVRAPPISTVQRWLQSARNRDRD
jgi:hypothetical protein